METVLRRYPLDLGRKAGLGQQAAIGVDAFYREPERNLLLIIRWMEQPTFKHTTPESHKSNETQIQQHPGWVGTPL